MTRFDSDRAQRIQHDLHAQLPSDPALRVKALETVLVRKGLIDPDAFAAWIDAYTNQIGPMRGARMVARAWTDRGYHARLMANAAAAADEFGYTGPEIAHLRALENTAAVHNIVVCTLCSSYPQSILGVSPAWYRDPAYRARVVRDPRGVLADFFVTLGDEVEIRVWDSTADLRYLVVPERPAGTAGWDEERLATLVTRNAMIGTERALTPGPRPL